MGISSLLEAVSSALPDRVLVGSNGEDALTAAALTRLAAAGAGTILDHRADAIAFLGVGGTAFPVTLFAAATAAVPFTPLNYRLSAAQILALSGRLGENPLLIVDSQYEDVARSARFPWYSTDQWLNILARERPSAVALPTADDEDIAVVLYTSGTTSEPKGSVLRHRHLLSYVLQTVEFGSAPESAAAIVSVPPYHVAGVSTVLTNAFAGRRTVYLSQFTPDGWLRSVREQRITQAMLVPTMLARVVDHLGEAPADVPALQSISYGGARMPRPVIAAALNAMPHVNFTNAYGLTETSSTIALLSPEDHRQALDSADEQVRARLGSAGRVLSGIEAQIRDDVGNPVPPGCPGRLWLRGEQVAGEYLSSGSLLDAQGWFDTRDEAWLDDDGYLFIVGRADDTIIRGGENIAPAEIEDVLLTHPLIDDAVVVGVADEEWGSRIVAAIVLHSSSTVSDDCVKSYVRERLRGSRTPDDVVIFDSLPYTTTGKVLRREVVAMVQRSV